MSFTARKGEVTADAACHVAPGRADCSARTNRAHARSDTASIRRAPIRRATIATGSSVSAHGRTLKCFGRGTTRGASSSGTTSVAELEAPRVVPRPKHFSVLPWAETEDPVE